MATCAWKYATNSSHQTTLSSNSSSTFNCINSPSPENPRTPVPPTRKALLPAAAGLERRSIGMVNLVTSKVVDLHFSKTLTFASRQRSNKYNSEQRTSTFLGVDPAFHRVANICISEEHLQFANVPQLSNLQPICKFLYVFVTANIFAVLFARANIL